MKLYRVEDSDTGTPVFNRHGNCWYIRESSAKRALNVFKSRSWKRNRNRYHSAPDYSKLTVRIYEVKGI